MHGVGEIELKFTFGNFVILTNVFFVSKVRKNLVFAGLLDKFGFTLVIEANKFILSKGSIFVGKGYYCNGIFKLNILAMSNKKNDEFSVYLIESSFNLWHNRFRHVNYKRMHI